MQQNFSFGLLCRTAGQMHFSYLQGILLQSLELVIQTTKSLEHCCLIKWDPGVAYSSYIPVNIWPKTTYKSKSNRLSCMPPYSGLTRMGAVGVWDVQAHRGLNIRVATS